jgi:twitching motility protein PilT
MTSLVPSLLRSFVDADGEALVMHAGERPYVIGPRGQVELANRPLTMEAVKGIVSQLLPGEVSHSLEEFGAVQHEIVSSPGFPGESFTVVAARSRDDMWVEIRRRKVRETDTAPELPIEPAAQRLAIAATLRRGAEAVRPKRQTSAAQPTRSTPPATSAPELPPTILSAMAAAPPPLPAPTATSPSAPPTPRRTPHPDPTEAVAVQPSAVVVPMQRGSARSETAADVPAPSVPSLDRLLRIAAAQGASMLYLSSNAPPSVRVEDEVWILEGEPSLAPQDLESLLLTAVPDAQYDRLRSGLAVDWTSDVDGVGRVRCTTFRDQRGPGGVLRMMPARAMSSERLGLSREVESLVLEPGGLVLVAGPRLSGKGTIISALVALINHRRRDHVITIEGEIQVVHVPGTSIISQREVRGGPDDFERAARAALLEDPDVLVIESMQSPALIDIALEGAASGRLVIGGLAARDAVSAVARIVNSSPAETTRRRVQCSLAEHLVGIVAQVLLHKTGGGRVAAREILLKTPAVASAISEGRTSQLALAIDAGRRQGMQPLNDDLVSLVQSGAVEASEAYRRAGDRTGLLARLKRLGVDVTAIDPAG